MQDLYYNDDRIPHYNSRISLKQKLLEMSYETRRFLRACKGNYIAIQAIQAIQGCFAGGRTDALLNVLDSTKMDPTYNI